MLLNHIAAELYDATRILSAVRRDAQAESGGRAAGELRRPETAVETALHAIWTELLNIRDCHIDDDFFALGGRSLLAVQMFSRIQEGFGIELPLDAVFNESLTIATLAERIDRLKTSGAA